MEHYSVLIVEDEPSYSHIFQEVLERVGFKTEVASSAEEALELISKEATYDVILLDYYLPGMNGSEFLNTIRSIDVNSIVICVSGTHDIKVVQEVYRIGADDFISKMDLGNLLVLEKSIFSALERKRYRERVTRAEISAQRLDAIGNIIRTVHHELNNPLAAIEYAFSRLIASEPFTNEESKELLLQAEEGIKRIADILRKLPEFRMEQYSDKVKGMKVYSLPVKTNKNSQ
ncbi:MAG: response regulator [bacterium]